MSKHDTRTKIRIRELTPAELTERVKAVKASPKPLTGVAAAIDILKKEGWMPWQIWTELTRRKAEFVPQILESFENAEPNDMERRMRIAGYLARLGVPSGHDFIITHLRNPDPQSRWMALLNWDVQEAPPRNEAEKGLLLSLLHDSDPRIRGMAVEACGITKVEGSLAAFEKMFESDDCPNRRRVALWLLRNDCSEKHIDMVLNFLNRTRDVEDTRWSLIGLNKVAKSGPSAIAAKARNVIEDFFLHSENKHKYRPENLALFNEIGIVRDLPAFELVLAQATEDVSRYRALEAIARLKPSLAVKRLAPHLDHWALSKSFLRNFEISATEQDWDDLVQLVLDALAAKRKNLNITNAIVDLMLEHGKEAGRSLIVTELACLWPTVRMHAMWKLNHWTIQDTLQALKKCGLIEIVPDDSLIEKVRQEQTVPVADADIFYEVLRAANILRKVPSEAENRPPNHCDLLAKFSEITNGVFIPGFCRQVTIKKTVDDPEFMAKLNQERAAKSLEPLPLEEEFYQVSFVVGFQLYEFETYASQRDYDIQAVETAVNTALEEASEDRRLVSVPSEDGFNLYFFGDPGRIRQFCTAYAIPL